MTYEIIFKKSALKDLMSLPAPDVNSIVQKIDDLALNPRPRDAKNYVGEIIHFGESDPGILELFIALMMQLG